VIGKRLRVRLRVSRHRVRSKRLLLNAPLSAVAARSASFAAMRELLQLGAPRFQLSKSYRCRYVRLVFSYRAALAAIYSIDHLRTQHIVYIVALTVEPLRRCVEARTEGCFDSRIK